MDGSAHVQEESNVFPTDFCDPGVVFECQFLDHASAGLGRGDSLPVTSLCWFGFLGGEQACENDAKAFIIEIGVFEQESFDRHNGKPVTQGHDVGQLKS